MTYLLWLFGVVILPVLTTLPYYTAINSTQSFIRRHGPMLVANQSECALACSCASGLLSNAACKVFNPSMPNVNCLAYSYDFNTRQCALLGGPSPNMCSEPVTIYELGNSTGKLKCGPTTIDERVICDSEGYKCPGGYLPYLLYDKGTPSHKGANLIYFEGNFHKLRYVADFPMLHKTSMVQNITCHPASSHSYDACKYNGKSPMLVNALTLKDTFGCLPGFEYMSSTRTFSKRLFEFYTVPVCTVDGWAEKEGGPIAEGVITEVACKKIV